MSMIFHKTNVKILWQHRAFQTKFKQFFWQFCQLRITSEAFITKVRLLPSRKVGT